MTSGPRRLVLAVFVALAIFVAFFPVLEGRLPVPATNALFLLPERPSVDNVNDELWDVPTQYLPWGRAVADAYLGGSLPLRFAANGCGTPLWANPQAQVLTPTTALLLALPQPWAMAAAAAVRLFAAAAGTLLLLTRLGLSPASASWGGIAYGFSLTFTTWLHYPLTYPQAMLPWILLASDALARGRRGAFGGGLAAGALLLLGGYPEGELFVVLAAAAFFAVRLAGQPGQRVRRFGVAALAALGALGLTAVLTLPQLLAISASERSFRIARGPDAQPSAGPPAPWRPPSNLRLLRFWAVPEAEGNPRDGDKTGAWSFAGRTSGYAGILVVAFALGTLAWRRAPVAVRAAQAGAILVALYLLGYPLLIWVLEAIPGVRDIHHRVTPSRAAGVFVLVIAALAAIQLERNRRGEGRGATRAAAALLFVAVAVVFVRVLDAPGPPQLTPVRVTSFLLPLALLAGAVGLLGKAPSSRRAVLTGFVVFGTALELLRIGARVSSGTPEPYYFPATPSTDALRRASAGGRFASDSPLYSGIANMYGLEDVSVQDPMAPAFYGAALQAAAGYTGPEQPFAYVSRLDAPLLDFLNVRARAGPGGRVQTRETPAATLPDRVIGCRSDAEVLERMASAPDFLRTAYAVGGDETYGGTSQVLSVETPRPEEIRVRLKTDGPRLLALPVVDDGGWTAESGGQTLETVRIDHAFLGVRVPRGAQSVVCRYRPPGLLAGAWISLATAVLIAAAAWLRRSGGGIALAGSVRTRRTET